MSHDPYDNGYSDDPDRAERERGPGDDPSAERTARTVAAARASTAAPGLFLILNGLFGLLCVAFMAFMVFQPERFIKAGREFAAQQPPGPDRQKFEDQLNDVENQFRQNRAAIQIQNAIQLSIPAFANLIAVLGGFSMRRLGSYGLSMFGAIASLIPMLTGCCCTGCVFGLWALLVLLRPEVRAGFVARRSLAYTPDLY